MFSNHNGFKVKAVWKAVFICLLIILPFSISHSIMASQAQGIEAIPHLLNRDSISLSDELPLISSAQTIVSPATTSHHDSSVTSADERDLMATASSPSVMFIENMGQFAEEARFQVRGAAHTLWLAEDGLWINLLEEVEAADAPYLANLDELVSQKRAADRARRAVNIKLNFVGANQTPRIEPFDRLETYFNYFQGDESSKWRSQVRTWGGVRYVDLYPGIDLEITSENGQLVQRIVADTDADLASVRLRAEGADKLALNGNQLRLTTAIGDVAWPLLQLAASDGSPAAEQEEKLGQPTVRSNEITAPFSTPSSAAMQISEQTPFTDTNTLRYSTFVGAGGDDFGNKVKLDSSGHVVVTGRTSSSDFPVVSGVSDHNGDHDLFVFKLSSDGKQLLYSTFIGGDLYDEGRDLEIDQNNNIVVVGFTQSSNFPTTYQAYDSTYHGNHDAVVLKLKGDGTELLYSTFIGEASEDYAYSVALDNSQNIVVAGRTLSSSFPTTQQAYDTEQNGNDDVFVLKLSNDGQSLLYSTFVGGSQNDGRYVSVAVDNSGNAVVTGVTSSDNFPTAGNPYSGFKGGSDAFLFKLASDGSDLLYSTFIGGRNSEHGNDLALDANGNIIVVGSTSSEDFPTTQGAYSRSLSGSDDAFVLKFAAKDNSLLLSTFIGGSASDNAADLVLDQNGDVIVSGYTSSSNFPTTDSAYDATHNGSSDIFVSKLASDGSSLLYSTFVGGSSSDYNYSSLEIDNDSNVIVTGGTTSSDFPTTDGAYDTAHHGREDVFVFSLNLAVVVVVPPAVRIDPVIQVDGKDVVPTAGTAITVIYDELETSGQPLIRWRRKYKLEDQEESDFTNKATVGAGNTIAEEEWCVTVTPLDGTGTASGAPEESCAYIESVPNQLPEAAVEVPEAPTVGEPLTVTLEISDDDGNADAKDAQVRWYRDDLLQPKFNDSTSTQTYTNTNVGEVWCAIARAHDGIEFGGASEKKCTIINPPEGALPFITNAQINPSKATSSESLTLEYTYNDPDALARGAQNVEIRWFRNGKLQSQLNNSRRVAARLTLPGETWWATIRPSSLQTWRYGRSTQSNAVDISADTVNTAPEARNLIINPQQPSTQQDLRLTYDFLDVDDDSQGETSIEWYRNLQYVEEYEGVRVIPAAQTNVGEVWHAIVIPHDGTDFGERVAARSVRIRPVDGNNLPEAREVYLSPREPGVDDNLVINYTYHDQDEDFEGDTAIEWLLNGEIVTRYNGVTVLPSQATRVGQTWCAHVKPHDGEELGNLVESNCVTITQKGNNTPPTVSDVHILPAVPRSSDDLVVHYEYFDADGDAESGTRINWYVDGKPFHKSGFENVTVIPSAYTLPNQLWQVVVQVNDGSNQYSDIVASNLIIINTPPEVSNAEITVLQPVLENGLRLDYKYDDKDKNPEGLPAIKWYKNGVNQSRLNNQKTVPAAELALNQKWYAAIETFDEYEYSQMSITDEVTLASLFLPLVLRPEEDTTPPPTPTSTPTPTVVPAYYEDNDTQETAYGPLEFAQDYRAYPEDENDWYIVTLNETSSLKVVLSNYQNIRDKGQLVIYETFMNREANTVNRAPIANHGGASSTRKIPNPDLPHALTDLAPGRYLIRIYTEERHHETHLYNLNVNTR